MYWKLVQPDLGYYWILYDSAGTEIWSCEAPQMFSFASIFAEDANIREAIIEKAKELAPARGKQRKDNK